MNAPAPGLALLLDTFAGISATSAQDVAVGLPANASAKTCDDGWTCNRGCREDAGACLPINPPANAHLDHPGNGRDCGGPYLKQQDECALQ